MAAPLLKITAPRASSVLSQISTASPPVKAVPAGAPTSITTKAWVTLQRVFFTVADVGQAGKLYDILNRMQESSLKVFRVVGTNQLVPGNILRGITFTAAQSQTLSHGLGRAWQGYFLVRAAPGSATTFLTDGVYPAGVTADQVIPLTSSGAGTYDVYVF